MRRIAKRTLVIATVLTVLAIAVSAAAYGYFTSGRTITNNEVSTGTIQLTVNDDGTILPVNLAQLMPGDSGTVGNYILKNVGDTAGTLWIGLLGHTGDGEFDDGLAQALQVAFWLDVDGNNLWSTGDKYFSPDQHYTEFQTGDTPALPAGAYNTLYSWDNSWSNTLDVPGAQTAGTLRMTYTLPGSVDDPALMGKHCLYDLMVELHQYHPDTNTITLLSVSGHTGATWSAFADGILVDTGTVGANGYVITLPVDEYTLVFDQGAWTYTKQIDISIIDQAFDLPV